ncbi:unnamed protein product [Peronospora belbahrii]|uniref:TAZ-type domain-containing protein n=1 Tax=Peronospora belbahrii TaxID=622444 RepID=A0AAU9L5M3_9STRA|nr:unnamed protein product [Peronospora belbahrii]
MMAWPEEPQSRNGNGELTELHESAYFFSSNDGDERAQHGATNCLGASQGTGQTGLTYSASCPSLSGLETVDDLIGKTAGTNDLMSDRFRSQEPSVDIVDLGEDLSFEGYRTLDILLKFQQDYQNTLHRQFPHQQVMGQSMDFMQQQMTEGRRGFHGSQSLTNLSRMESDYNGMNSNSKRKKGSERWMKLQRHKSFDSATPISESFDLDPNASFNISMSSSNPTPDQLLQGQLDNDMVGSCLNDLPSSMQSNDLNWPLVACGSAPSSIGENYIQQVHHKRQPPQVGMQSTSDAIGDNLGYSSTEVTPMSELDMLLSDNDRANLFDAIRDFELPGGLELVATQHLLDQSQQTTQLPLPNDEMEQINTSIAKSNESTFSPANHPKVNKKIAYKDLRPFSLDSSTTPSTGMPPSGSISMRTRLHQILVLSVQNSDAGSSLSALERNYLMQSPLFFPARAPETAGSLWLLLHAAQCESGCDIAGCCVMRRVLTHCLGCELVLGNCKQPCNDAKAMLLHYGSCNSKGSMHGRSCSVCWNLLEIDYFHQALSNDNNNGRSNDQALNSAPSPFFMKTSSSVHTGTSSHVAMPIISGPEGSRAYCPPSRRSTSAPVSSKHVPIQPNPLPTASNPVGLIGTLPPRFGYSLALYLEQTSATFRAEVKSRVEKRVTTAAGQDLLQHMQKKTRLRSLDHLRSDARTIVLGEMEQELYLHMQAYNWTNSRSGGSEAERALQLPPYLTNFFEAGINVYQAQ